MSTGITRCCSFFISIIIFYGCSVSNEQTTQINTKFPEGRALYLSKCTACHRAYDRKSYNTEQWYALLNNMGNKAKLSVDEKELILKFLMEE